MSYSALDFVDRAIRGLKHEGEFETYKTQADIKESWIDDLETIRDLIRGSTPTMRNKRDE